MKLRFCVRCQMDKPADGFTCRLTGKLGRNKVYECADCTARRKATGNAKERDAFGRRVSEQNKAVKKSMVRHIPNKF